MSVHEMKLPFYLAFQYVWRGRKWTLILTIMLMAVAFINLIFISGLLNGIVIHSNQQVINSQTGNVYLTPKGEEKSIPEYQNVLETVRSTKRVQAASSQLKMAVEIKSKKATVATNVVVVQPNDEHKTTSISTEIIRGQYLETEDKDGIIIGKELAGGKDAYGTAGTLKGVEIGDVVRVSILGIERDMTVRGIFETKYIMADMGSYLSRKALEEFLPTTNNTANFVVVKTDNQDDAQVRADLTRKLPDLETHEWRDAAGFITSISNSFISIDAIITLVGIVIAGVTIFIVIYIDIVNKRRQIGIQRAIGIPPRVIVASYVLLALFYAFLGVIIGGLLYQFALVPYFIAHPLELPIANVTLSLKPEFFILRVGIIIVASLFSGLIPAVLVARSKMLDAILGSR